jgi:hypothetical protein
MIVGTDVKGHSRAIKARAGRGSATRPKRLGGEIMKKKCASILLTFICLLGLSGAAKAEIRGQIRVTLPFEFVVDGKTLPAGTYTLSTFSDDKFAGLILSNHDHRIGVFVHPVEIEGVLPASPK